MSESPSRFVVPFNEHARVEFAAVAEGACTARIPAAHELTNHVGTVHGGALFTVAEAASGRAFMHTALTRAAASGIDVSAFRAVVRNAQIRFRKPARGEISAHARVVTDASEWLEHLRTHGKALANVHVEVKDTSGTLVAEMQVEWHVSARRDDDRDDRFKRTD